MSISPHSLFQRARRERWFASYGALSPRRILGALAVLGIVAATPAFFRWLRHDGEADILTDPSVNTGPSVSARNMQILERDDNGQRIWQIEARKIVVSFDKRYVTATDLERGIYFRNDKPYLYIKAAKVRFDQQTRDWHSPSAFTVRGPDGFILKSHDASWNNALKTLDCPQRVVATMKGSTIETSQVIYHANISQLRSRQPVNVKKEGIEVKGAPAVADLKKETVQFNGGVDMTIQPKVVEGMMR